MAQNLISKYVWIIDTIYKAGRISFKELKRCWLYRTDRKIKRMWNKYNVNK